MYIKNILLSLVVLIFIVNIRVSLAQYNKGWSEKYESNRCPKLYPKNFINYAPIGNLTAGNYTEKTGLKGLRQCVMACCLAETCNIVFIFDARCFHVECVSNELCLPLLRAGSRKWESHVSMILVKPVLLNENWSDILDQSSYRDVNTNFASEDESAIYSPYTSHHRELLDNDDSNFLARFLNNLPNIDDEDSRNFDKYRDNNDSDMIMDATSFLDKVPCVIGAVDECPFNAECIPLGLKTNNGICKCVPGTEENSQGVCVQMLRPYSKGSDLKKTDDTISDRPEDVKIDSSSPKTVQTLTVSIVSKEVQLPENEVTLAAYTIPDEKATNSHYNYIWTLVNQPKGGFTGNMNQNGAKVTLTDLTEGQYRFKVTVNGTSAYGEGFANVTVLPPQRINKPPLVVVTPQTQTVKLPNSVAVLDGSGSKDDDAIISWHWELISGPIGYQPPLQDGSTLVLKDLKQAGNYTFRLTVEDSDHVKNSTTANITVLNHTDYPPEANAGQDVIIYLPNNSLTLNGNLSTDDHEITSWEWTKAAEDENKAVDMQNTHSPYLQLSNLSEGMYTFMLKVTDSSGQSSTAEVHVYVKPPTNTPPIADAGRDIFISLPQTWVTLNGTASHDDHRIVAYTWRCLDGPTNSSIMNYNESIANATGLTKGQYIFSLTVLDDNGNTATDNITVTVTQNKNSPPKADAGGDLILSLPLPVLVLNGSKSSDDFRVVSWKWTRSGSGLAAGTVIMHSDTQPILMLTNIEPGRYVFELTVADDQGETDNDAVSVQVKPDPMEMNLLEITLNVPVSTFTQSQLESLVQKITLLLKEDIKINVIEIRGEVDTDNTQLIFYLHEEGKAVQGSRALSLVRSARRTGGDAWGVARLRSVRCLSMCSGRGVCEHATRACRCDAFWMQSLLTQSLTEIWKVHRKVLLPIFHNKVVEEYIDLIAEQAGLLAELLDEQAGKGNFDVLKYISPCTVDIMFETSLGERMDVQRSPDTAYMRARNTLLKILNMRVFKVWMQPDFLFNLTPYAKQQRESIACTRKFTDKVVKKKRIEYENRKNNFNFHDVKTNRKIYAAVDLLFGKEIEFTDEQVREHLDSFTVAGNDTTALVIAYTVVLFGIHQDIQEKVYKEQIEIFGDSLRGPVKEDFQKMQYLERVIKESMRFYTVVPIIARHVEKDTYLPHCGVTIPAGSGAVIGTFAIHRNKEIWGPSADEFDPDRFLPERSADRHPAAFLGFSCGIRNCIGRHFGMIIMKSILSSIIRSYKIYADDIDKMKIEMLLFPVKGHQIKIEKR